MKPLCVSDLDDLVLECAGIIAFDALICRYCSTHFDSPERQESSHSPIAVFSLKGCEVSQSTNPCMLHRLLNSVQVCQSAPEGPAIPGKSPPEPHPLVSPPPLYTSTDRAAQMPANAHSPPPLFARCQRCLKDRHCKGCNAWWCESCYTPPKAGSPIANVGINVHVDLWVSKCLVGELYSGAGEGGMWGYADVYTNDVA